MEKLTHLDNNGNAVMVDISDKEVTKRIARASGRIRVSTAVLTALQDGTNKKGDVLAAARIAGIMAAKQTSSLIPLCHPLMIRKCSVDFEIEEAEAAIRAIAAVHTEGKTGVEMEALTAVTTALLTIYDMCKAIDKGMEITEICLLEKSGGKSGDYQRETDYGRSV